MGIHLKILAIAAVILGFAALVPSDRACAGPIAAQTCDTEVWRAMATRARIETEREIMQNQNLIFKPDSILAYTCFDSMASHAAAQAGVLFTHTAYWTPMPVQWGNQSNYLGMDAAINRTVLAAMRTYYTSNFQHEMLGGRGRELALPMHEVTSVPSSNSTYACSMMGQVWATAKCLNFLHNLDFAASDGFYPFINLSPIAGNEITGYEGIEEVRNYPNPCTAPAFSDSTWMLQYRQSRNETDFGTIDALYMFGTPVQLTFEAARERLEPGACGPESPPIPTGVTVILSTNSEVPPYADGVCSNPGCTFSGTSNQCVNSVPTDSAGPRPRPTTEEIED